MGHNPLDEQQNDSAGEGDDDLGEEAGGGVRSSPDSMKDEASNHGTDQPEDDVTDEAETAAADDSGGDGSGNQTDEQPSKDVMTSDGCERYEHGILHDS
jgi:hypothetical protein